jgi:hypothetical protein
MSKPVAVDIPWGWGSLQYHSQNTVKYTLPASEFENLWAQQKGCCAVCGVVLAHPTRKALNKFGAKCVVDHKHAVGEKRPIARSEIRGLLCIACNALLGSVRENITVFEGAARYLREQGVSAFDYLEKQVTQTRVQEFEERLCFTEEGGVELLRIPL